MDAVPAASFFSSSPAAASAPRQPKKIAVKSVHTTPYVVVSDEDEVDELMEDSLEPIPLKKHPRPFRPDEAWKEHVYPASQYSDDTVRNIASSSKFVKPYSPPPPKVVDPEGGGWTTSKLLAMKDEGGGIEGIWPHGVVDFKVLPYPAGMPAPGTFLPSPRVQSLDEQGNPIEGVSEEQPPLKTMTKEEFDVVRPHPDAFFSRSTYSWVVLTPILPNAPPPVASSNLPANRPHLWRVVPDVVTPASVSLGPIFPPARPDLLSPRSSIDESDLEIRNLSRLSSSKSPPLHFAYSLEKGIPTVIPFALWTAFEKARSDPLPQDSGRPAALAASWAAVWRSVVLTSLRSVRS